MKREIEGRARDLAVFDLATDSKLRGSEVASSGSQISKGHLWVQAMVRIHLPASGKSAKSPLDW
jgi:hypothetical protein